MTNTILVVSEKANYRRYRSKYILKDFLGHYHFDTNNKELMNKCLDFLECTVEKDDDFTTYTEKNGKTEVFRVSKNIISKCDGGFWNLDQLREMINGRRYKSFTGLSNGSLVTCYAAFDDDKNTVEIVRPNPNAKEVYKPLETKEHIKYKESHWYL